MSFITQHLLKGTALQKLPSIIKNQTLIAIQSSQKSINSITSGLSYKYPCGITTLQAIDEVSNDCCKVIDSALIVFKNFSEQNKELQDSCVESMNSINDFFGGEYLNQNKKLLNQLISIQMNQIQYTMLDDQDRFLLHQAIQDLNSQQKINDPLKLQRMQEIDGEIHALQRRFMRNLSQDQYQLSLTQSELKSIPNRQLQNKYQALFKNETEKLPIIFDKKYEFEVAKFSPMPSVRRQFFLQYANTNKSNTQEVIKLVELRRELGTQIYQEKSYFDKQKKLQSLKFKRELKEIIYEIQQQIRPQCIKDIENIKRITGELDVRYYDIAFLKEKVKAIMLSQDPNNIQMLTCFTLQNTFRGLMILAAQVFQQTGLKLYTVIYNQETGKSERLNGYQLFTKLITKLNPNEIPLIEVTLKDGGKIIMDIFYRPFKLHKNQTQTLTEQGSNLFQRPVAYLLESLPIDTNYLSYDQVKNLFHEFGHALNIALSKTKYQYYSGARATLDLVETPSHLTELFLKDYYFVQGFAFNESNVPISREIFNKMIFCDELFRLLNLEETLYFTLLDLELNSFQKGQKLDENKLIEINKDLLTQSFSCNYVKQSDKISGQITQDETNKMIELYINQEQTQEIYKDISHTLFTQQNTNHSNTPQTLELDPSKVQDYENNYLFNKFHHLFEYDATYYSYLIAKICSQRIYLDNFRGLNKSNFKIGKEAIELFENGGYFKPKEFNI